MNRKAFVVAVLALAALSTGVSLWARSQPGRTGVTRLHARSAASATLSDFKALLTRPNDDRVVAWEDGRASELGATLDALQPRLLTLNTANAANAVAIGRRGRVIAAWRNSGTILGTDGRPIRSIPLPKTESIATLSTGDFAVASATVTGLIHVYSVLGAQRGHFGRMKHLDNDARENQFLNQGIVMADADGGYFYAFANAPQTTVQRFAPNGDLIDEFPVYGRSLESHAGEARTFLTSRQPDDIGGFRLIVAGDFNRQRGTLFLATTARSAGWETVYEYAADGTKMGEYNLIRQDGTEIHYLRDLVARGPHLTVLDDKGVAHSFVLPTPGPFASRFRAGPSWRHAFSRSFRRLSARHLQHSRARPISPSRPAKPPDVRWAARRGTAGRQSALLQTAKPRLRRTARAARQAAR